MTGNAAGWPGLYIHWRLLVIRNQMGGILGSEMILYLFLFPPNHPPTRDGKQTD
jgi:hypothetical protein